MFTSKTQARVELLEKKLEIVVDTLLMLCEEFVGTERYHEVLKQVHEQAKAYHDRKEN